MQRVLLFTPRFPPYGGGSAVYFSTLTDNLSESVEFEIVTSYHTDAPLIEHQQHRTIYRVIPRRQTIPLVIRIAIESLVTLLVVLKIGLSDGFDLIHSHSSNTSIPAIIAAAGLFGKPVIYDCRDESFLPSLITLGKTPYWFSCADSIDAKLIDSGVPAERIIRTPVTNPPYVSEIQPVTNDEAFDICYAGVLREEKGVFLLLDAFETFASNHPDATLTLVGDGPAQAELESRIMELDLTERIELTGELDHRQTLRRIGGADVFVLPSESEGLPRTMLEAFELETAVIATSVGDIPTYLDDERTGLMIEPSSQAIVKAIERLYTNPALRTELESNATELLDSDRWNTISNRVLGAYEHAGDRRT